PSLAQRGKVPKADGGALDPAIDLRVWHHAKSAPISPFGTGALAPSMALALRAPSACKSAVLPICPPLHGGSNSFFLPLRSGGRCRRRMGALLILLLIFACGITPRAAPSVPSGQVHSRHPWRSPFGRLRRANRRSCRFVPRSAGEATAGKQQPRLIRPA